MESLKPPKTFKEQLEILKKRGLIINDETFALSTLKSINYYRLSGYMFSIKTPGDKFFPNITFENLYLIYIFDKKLRLLLLDKIENVEISFRTHIAYHLAHKYGSDSYKCSENFCNEKYHKQFLGDLQKDIEKSRDREIFIEHYIKKYSGEFPVWIIIEIISFGNLSKLFKNLKDEDKKIICETYYKIPYKYIESWLHHLSYIRNICAHYSRIYGKIFKVLPKFSKKDKKIFRPTHRIFDTIRILKKLTIDKNEWLDFINKLKILLSDYSIIDKKSLGFSKDPDDVFEFLLIDSDH